ncbi:MAG TPA: hypothetical protein VKM96_02170 [Candidatus Bathyarchaeia archaeon]|nr:hypothetical protein [Candidatus Bathyarchaeia archaeon]
MPGPAISYFPLPQIVPAVKTLRRNLYGLAGLVLVPLGALAVVASMVVLIGRKQV